ncbi:UDP-glucose/GDP-mannose dehydrogenase family protein [Microcella sp.]|uniref:UDP-glucose dehydrogenase family protein n=1 Tax=Microcella sp. TaxID=1913979 RepID=UPI00299F6C5B|nr:UDP-glucose/GDP-mannose dehydrogenase family protein [Microcella sp.]MDX2026142.1 UDP-glucose/GDP-mannose dehydrogenase family protein [Microcella sp.]
MRISVIGCGYLGAVHAAAMAELGHEVVGIDLDPLKIDTLAKGGAPFFEPGLTELLERGIAAGRLSFSTDIEAARGASVHFIAVGTPQRPDGSADLTAVNASLRAVIGVLTPGDLVVGKSTVPVGTAQVLQREVERAGGSLAWNPEFLREGFAVRDSLEPDRMVYGVTPGDSRSAETLDRVYRAMLTAGTPRMVTDLATAELVKVAANAFLATKISFINAMAEIAEVAGADVTQLADAIGYDARIGRRFLNAGIGFGGGCLPKDIRGFIARADELGVGHALDFLRDVDQVNLRRRDRVVDLTRDALGGSLVGRRVTVLGLAFKPDSDDVRDSPALDIARRLHAEGAIVTATDPEAIETSRPIAPDLTYRDSVHEAVLDAEVVLVLTEWALYRQLDPVIAARLASPSAVVIDGRLCLDAEQWRAAGWRYRAPGRLIDRSRDLLAV